MGITKKGMAANRSKGKEDTGPKAKGTAQNARRKPLSRPATRKIVRWNGMRQLPDRPSRISMVSNKWQVLTRD